MAEKNHRERGSAPEGGSRFPDLEDIQREVQKLIRNNNRFLETFMEENFMEEDEGEEEENQGDG